MLFADKIIQIRDNEMVSRMGDPVPNGRPGFPNGRPDFDIEIELFDIEIDS